MNFQELFPLAAIAVAMLLLTQPVAAATLKDVFGAFASLGKENPQYDFDRSGGKITLGDVITALLSVFGLGGGAVACSKVADCPQTIYSSPYCDGNNLVHDVTAYICLNPGTLLSRCHASTETALQKACQYGCADGNCLALPGCETTETSCTDLRDNDCDGKFDCDDSDCESSDDCRIYATTYDARFPVKGGITTAYMEINGCIEIIGGITVAGVPPLQPTNPIALYLSPQADDNCVNWPIEGNTIFLKNLSGQTLDVYNASVSLGPSHFDDYTMNSCSFFGHFSSDRCPDSSSGDKGGFTELFGVTSINGVPGQTQDCSINASILADQEIRVGVSDFSYCANRLPPECECSTDELLRSHKDNPITITLNTNIGTINIYLYNFPTDSPIT